MLSPQIEFYCSELGVLIFKTTCSIAPVPSIDGNEVILSVRCDLHTTTDVMINFKTFYSTLFAFIMSTGLICVECRNTRIKMEFIAIEPQIVGMIGFECLNKFVYSFSYCMFINALR